MASHRGPFAQCRTGRNENVYECVLMFPIADRSNSSNRTTGTLPGHICVWIRSAWVLQSVMGRSGVRNSGAKSVAVNPGVDAPPAESWRCVVNGIPTVFGRLVYLRSLADGADPAIGRAAQQIFSQWVAMGLLEQARDLRAYRSSNRDGGPADHGALVPPGAREVERLLFLTDMETLDGLLALDQKLPASML